MAQRPKRLVITVHGIGAGAWQEEVSSVLEPHFQHEAVRYSQYREYGFFHLLIGPIASILAASILLYSHLIQRASLSAQDFYLVSIACFFLITGFSRRRKAVQEVKRQIDWFTRNSQRAHAIAHSFGTYALGRILLKWPNVKFDDLILTGGVMPANYPWVRLLTAGQPQFKRVRNEVAKGDWLARSAMFLKGFIPGFGHSGYAGFNATSEHVHVIRDPMEPCQLCSNGHMQARIHNVHHSGFDHTDHFVGRGHAERFWLPTLWRLDPAQYSLLLDRCAEIEQLHEAKANDQAAIVEADIRNATYDWANGKTLVQFLTQLVKQRPNWPDAGLDEDEVQLIVDLAVFPFWKAIRAAQAATTSTVERTRCLHPALAATKAVELAIRGRKKTKR